MSDQITEHRIGQITKRDFLAILTTVFGAIAMGTLWSDKVSQKKDQPKDIPPSTVEMGFRQTQIETTLIVDGQKKTLFNRAGVSVFTDGTERIGSYESEKFPLYSLAGVVATVVAAQEVSNTKKPDSQRNIEWDSRSKQLVVSPRALANCVSKINDMPDKLKGLIIDSITKYRSGDRLDSFRDRYEFGTNVLLGHTIGNGNQPSHELVLVYDGSRRQVVTMVIMTEALPKQTNQAITQGLNCLEEFSLIAVLRASGFNPTLKVSDKPPPLKK